MSRTISIANRYKIADNISWRRDGEADQLIIVSREDLPLPLILNPTAAMIFLYAMAGILWKILPKGCARSLAWMIYP